MFNSIAMMESYLVCNSKGQFTVKYTVTVICESEHVKGLWKSQILNLLKKKYVHNIAHCKEGKIALH